MRVPLLPVCLLIIAIVVVGCAVSFYVIQASRSVTELPFDPSVEETVEEIVWTATVGLLLIMWVVIALTAIALVCELVLVSC